MAGIGLVGAFCALSVSAVAHGAITPLSQYGSDGTGAGQIDSPLDVGIDPATGDVYVADGNNYRVDVFAPDGAFLRAFGANVDPGGGGGPEVCTTSCQQGTSGTGAGQFSAIEGVEVSPSGNVFLADYGAQRIAQYTREGQFVRAFGADVIPGGGTGFEVCTTACQAGATDGSAGSVNNPWGMVIGPVDDLLYVTEATAGRISVFSQDGQFVRAFGENVVPGGAAGFEICTTSCQAGTANGGPGSIRSPEGLDFDPAGNLWIAEYADQRVSVFSVDPAPAFVRAFGANVVPGGGTGFEICATICQGGDTASAAGEFSQPQGVAVDALGTAYVADSGNSRVSVFGPASEFISAFGADVDPAGGTGFEICSSSCQAGDNGTAPGSFDDAYAPADDCHGAVYVTDVNNHRIQRFGEPGTPLGPCELAILKAKRNKRKGTAKLTIDVPAPGTVELSGKGIKKVDVEHEGFPGKETLKLKTKGKTREKLNENGSKKVRPTLTFDPGAVGEDDKSERTKLKLKKK